MKKMPAGEFKARCLAVMEDVSKTREHVWAWKDNPNGAFVNWHPNVNCQAFAGEAQ
jgi:hypothetical protein